MNEQQAYEVLGWGIRNEYDINGYPAANVAEVAKIVVELENAAGIPESEKLVFTLPVSFAVFDGKLPAIQQVLSFTRGFHCSRAQRRLPKVAVPRDKRETVTNRYGPTWHIPSGFLLRVRPAGEETA